MPSLLPPVWFAWRLWACVLLAMHAAGAGAKDKHVHGVVRLDVAVEAGRLIVMVVAPLDSLLEFEHRPRTAAQVRAAQALLQRLNEVAAVVRPDPAAVCALSRTSIDSAALTAQESAATSSKAGHSDLGVTYEFNCTQPQNLRSLEIGLFENFKRIRRIEVRTVGTRGQSARVLQRPERVVRLAQ